ncbi:MAG: hypothetical protein JWO33_1892 [Caulobacteraceae bacterium]|nr:hypothetical protein [Caulobacteraceae bacterium]
MQPCEFLVSSGFAGVGAASALKAKLQRSPVNEAPPGAAGASRIAGFTSQSNHSSLSADAKAAAERLILDGIGVPITGYTPPRQRSPSYG